jgi:hypothetical protein
MVFASTASAAMGPCRNPGLAASSWLIDPGVFDLRGREREAPPVAAEFGTVAHARFTPSGICQLRCRQVPSPRS